MLSKPLASLTLSLCLAAGAAQAGELYSNIGIPGVMLGYSHPLGPLFGVRADYATVGNIKDRRTEDGIDYDSKLKIGRAHV